jgi:localization factor PodJL
LPPAARLAPEDSQDTYFAEDDLLERDEILAPSHAASLADGGASPFSSSSLAAPAQGDDDLLVEDSLYGDEAPARPMDQDPFWAPQAELAPLETPAGADIPYDLVSEPPPGKNDYLANARKAALAQSMPKSRPEPGPTPTLSLRGSSRIVLWGAATTIAALLVGGAYYYSSQNAAPRPAHEPDAVTAPEAAPAEAGAPFEAPAPDPFAQAPAEAAASPPIAQAEGGAAQAVIAGPLAPRNVSLEQAAQAGDLTAQYDLALQRLGAGRTPEGVTLLRRAADRGFAMAQYRLAKLYERGEGVPADLTQARQWTERAAAAGNRRAMHDLGVYFARGEGAPLDEAAAFRWFRQAAELGVADSQYNLGVLYQQGRGVNASASEALFWFLVAARQGDQDAGARASALEGQLSAAQTEQARARAETFRPRAASAVANGEFGARPWNTRPAT